MKLDDTTFSRTTGAPCAPMIAIVFAGVAVCALVAGAWMEQREGE
jgi:hypothetical protein